MDPIVSNGVLEYHFVEVGTSPYPGSWRPAYHSTAGGSSFGWRRHRLGHVGSPLEVALTLMLLVWE